MVCKNCGQEIDKKAVVCTKCGRKIKKAIYKKWWFWFIVGVIAIAALSAGNDGGEANNDNTAETKNEEIVYEQVDFQKMIDELEDNAMKAEKNYQKKFVEIQCKIVSFDSDGQYISVEPVGASDWDFATATCYIKTEEQKNFLIEKNVGDTITVKGQVKSIGEIMGYSIDIKEVY